MLRLHTLKCKVIDTCQLDSETSTEHADLLNSDAPKANPRVSLGCWYSG